jgi:hypothetical protein
MSEMIELMARAIRGTVLPGSHDRDHDWDRIGEIAREMYRREARAAMEALRWPTKAMFEGWRAVNCIKDQPDFEEFTYFNGDYGGWLACHQSMIDAALTASALRQGNR